MHLKCKDWTRFCSKKAAPKVPEWPSYCNFLQCHPKPTFSEKVQKGDQGKFFKNHPKCSPRLKGLKALAQMALSSNQNALKVQRLEKSLREKSMSKSARMAKLWQFLPGHPKPAFSEKVLSGDQGKVFKNRQKRSPRLKGLKGL